MLERLNQLQFHRPGKASDIMVRLDHRTWTAKSRSGFYQIGVKGPLRQKFHVFDSARFLIKYVDKRATDNFAFPLRIGNPF